MWNVIILLLIVHDVAIQDIYIYDPINSIHKKIDKHTNLKAIVGQHNQTKKKNGSEKRKNKLE